MIITAKDQTFSIFVVFFAFLYIKLWMFLIKWIHEAYDFLWSRYYDIVEHTFFSFFSPKERMKERYEKKFGSNLKKKSLSFVVKVTSVYKGIW